MSISEAVHDTAADEAKSAAADSSPVDESAAVASPDAPVSIQKPNADADESGAKSSNENGDDDDDDNNDSDEDSTGRQSKHNGDENSVDVAIPDELMVKSNEVKNAITQAIAPLVDIEEEDLQLLEDEDDAVPGAGATAVASSGAGTGTQGDGKPDASEAVSGGGNDGDATADVIQTRKRRQMLSARYGYDHNRALAWTHIICDSVVERLVRLGKPYKFVVHSVIARRCGAGMHVCSSCSYSPQDGWLSHVHELSRYVYLVVTVYWCAIAA